MPAIPSPPPLVLITGAPASGKTTLARVLGEVTGWPVLHRDAIKETLLDEWGAADRAASRRIGGISWSLFHLLLDELAGRAPVIADANLTGPGIDRVLSLLARSGAAVLDCQADRSTLHRRVLARTDDPTRHAGHFDVDAWPELIGALDRGDYQPRAWPCPSLLVDTTADDAVDPVAVIRWLRDDAGLHIP
ncbi:MAG TPA: AAA family ATPase [Thermomicrobiales bacterium]|jgi:predicted kinase|nr:AAA family ATPase [Thermomicrobiales bacterium]